MIFGLSSINTCFFVLVLVGICREKYKDCLETGGLCELEEDFSIICSCPASYTYKKNSGCIGKII